jgi:hypothetical protein
MAAPSDTNFGKPKGTSKVYDSSTAFDLKFLDEIAAGGAGTSKSAELAGRKSATLRLLSSE